MIKPSVLILGDVMLDEYILGDVTRISPEAPVPIINPQFRHESLGGAGNVARLVQGLGNDVELHGAWGVDPAGLAVSRLLSELGIKGRTRIEVQSTTTKTRLLSGGQHLLRIDHEADRPRADLTIQALSSISQDLDKFQAVIVSDYGKGMIPYSAVPQLMSKAAMMGVIVVIDTKSPDIRWCSGAHVITPNLKEGRRITGLNEPKEIANSIYESYDIPCLLTLGPQGMLLRDGDGLFHVPASSVEIADVTGAGDMVVAALTDALIHGAEMREAAQVASEMASEVVRHLGTTALPVGQETNEYMENRID